MYNKKGYKYMSDKIVQFNPDRKGKRGEIAVNEDKDFYQWKDGKWTKVEDLKQIKMNLGMTEYEFNQQVIEKLPSKITEQQLAPVYKIIKDFKELHKNKYYMLLCNDIHYYTVLHINNTADTSFEEIAVNCVQDIGVIQLVEAREDNEAVEICMKNKEGCKMFMLFPYDWGVVECE